MASLDSRRMPNCAIAGDRAVIVVDLELVNGLTRSVLRLVDESLIMSFPYSSAAVEVTQRLGGGNRSVRTVAHSISTLKQLGLLTHTEFNGADYLVVSDMGRLVCRAIEKDRKGGG